MKKKTSWKTLAGLALAAGAWRKFSEDLPIDGVIIPPPGPPAPPELPGPGTECPPGYYRKLIDGQWRCWPRSLPTGPPPDCGQFSSPKWDIEAQTWRCVPKGLL